MIGVEEKFLQDIELSVVMPTFNSEEHIEDVVSKLYAVLQGFEILFELIVVDDGSDDKTLHVLNKLIKEKGLKLTLLSNTKNLGQKRATIYGLSSASGRYIVVIDDDLQYNFNDIKILHKAVKDSFFLVVNGHYQYSSPQKWYNLIRNPAVFLTKLFFKEYIERNYFSSFKIFNKEALKKIGYYSAYFFWRIPIARVSSVPVEKRNSIRKGSSYSIKNRVRIFSHILFRINIIISLFFLLPLALLLNFALNSDVVYLFLVFIFLLMNLFLIQLEKRNYKQA